MGHLASEVLRQMRADDHHSPVILLVQNLGLMRVSQEFLCTRGCDHIYLFRYVD